MLLTRDLGSQQKAFCLLPVASFKSPLSLYKELVHIWHAGFYTATRDTHFDFLALVNNRDCVCGSHRTAEDTKAILNLLSPWALDKGANRNAHFPVFPCKRSTWTHWKLLSEGSDSNQLAARSWDPHFWDTGSSQHTLFHWEPLRKTKATSIITKVWDSPKS